MEENKNESIQLLQEVGVISAETFLEVFDHDFDQEVQRLRMEQMNSSLENERSFHFFIYKNLISGKTNESSD